MLNGIAFQETIKPLGVGVVTTDDAKLQTVATLVNISPQVFDIVFTQDMGFECSILTDLGVIFRIPGMLIDFSSGQWPIHDDMTGDESFETLANLISSLEFSITLFAKIDLETLLLIPSKLSDDEVPE